MVLYPKCDKRFAYLRHPRPWNIIPSKCFLSIEVREEVKPYGAEEKTKYHDSILGY